MVDDVTEDDYRARLGPTLVELRRRRAKSAAWLAEKINRSEAAISRWETGKVTPTAYDLYRVAEALDVPCELLIYPPVREETMVGRALAVHDQGASGKAPAARASGSSRG